jgi:hypothetical protein
LISLASPPSQGLTKFVATIKQAWVDAQWSRGEGLELLLEGCLANPGKHIISLTQSMLVYSPYRNDYINQVKPDNFTQHDASLQL